jgi:hypothetical protein
VRSVPVSLRQSKCQDGVAVFIVIAAQHPDGQLSVLVGQRVYDLGNQRHAKIQHAPVSAVHVPACACGLGSLICLSSAWKKVTANDQHAPLRCLG